MPKITSKDVALMAVFAALSVIVIKVFPGIPIYGVPNAQIKLDVALAPIYGIIIGPYLGFLSGFFGGLVLANRVDTVLTSLCTGISAFVAGMLTRKRGGSTNTVPGWVPAGIAIGLLLLGWYSTPVGREIPYYPILHIAGFLIVIVGRGRIAKLFEEGLEEAKQIRWNPSAPILLLGIIVVISAYIFPKPYLSQFQFLSYLSIPLYFVGGIIILYGLLGPQIKGKLVYTMILATYCGIIADHMLGNLIYLNLYAIPPQAFMEYLPASVVERFTFTAIATLIGIGLILTLRRAGMLGRR